MQTISLKMFAIRYLVQLMCNAKNGTEKHANLQFIILMVKSKGEVNPKKCSCFDFFMAYEYVEYISIKFDKFRI